MQIDIKKSVKTVYQLSDIIDQLGIGIKAFLTKLEAPSEHLHTTKEAIRFEILNFLVRIIAVDQKITPSEVSFLNEILQFDRELSERDIKRMLDSVNDDIPELSLGIAVFKNADAKLREKGYLAESTGDIGEFLITVYELVGKEAMVADEQITENEIEVYTKYINMCKKTLQNEEISFDDYNSQDEKENKYKEINDNSSLEDLVQELYSLIGLTSVKQDVQSLINLIQIRRIREKRGFSQPPMSLHLVFSGNPGTGKTSVARLLAKIYKKIGVLSKGQLVEVDRSNLVGGYVGQTALKVKDVVQSAIGGVLFIDEAYSLATNRDDIDFGKEAIDTLLKLMEDNRDDLIVIVAGYTELMEKFLNSNPGLKSRFNKFITFDDYTPQELLEIFESMCQRNNYTISNEVRSFTKDFFEQRYLNKPENFANARDVRNFFEKALQNQANRLARIDTIKLGDKELFGIELEDVEEIKLKD